MCLIEIYVKILSNIVWIGNVRDVYENLMIVGDIHSAEIKEWNTK